MATANNSSQIKIRKMTSYDYKQAYSLWERTPGMHLREADDSLAEISRLLRFNHDLCYIAEANKKIIGTIMGATDGRRGKIYHLAVDEEFRGLQVAKKLLDLVSLNLNKVGIRKISVCVMNNNELGIGFWEHCGYQKRTDISYFDRIL
ncbi:acetyltransferase [Liquorilactobacillus sucicola DSM 21376 = JCM 15457]|uniref:Acetyltransferase n=1 Tax=Liquorilactobacillus sucicola DSM 21376 = JCM 15457 TaxID=1423806 RepID=A0A023CUW0_9LACO|nr:GNAT family N-acetyltransferase [Liquorilactobacillus sucicola]KRN05577.1 acetyltransferase [Liquorilactobacillus sucicola DSM 21376 = JCM 15457]GAJ25663.1 acetyltransferase [Liquorilactobacillus sucicola DSM 21376 = JCM 15457]